MSVDLEHELRKLKRDFQDLQSQQEADRAALILEIDRLRADLILKAADQPSPHHTIGTRIESFGFAS